jgi:hypothetical protein
MSEKQLVKKIESITANEIRKVCKQYLVDPHMVTAVVG